MEFKKLSQRAVEIRNKYSELEEKKYGKVWSPEQIMEGLAGDVGDLMKIVMAKNGYRKMENVDEKLAHELSDCLWCVMVLSEKYGIDLEKAFLDTMDELEKRIAEDDSRED